ncbi:hypothetical protein [Teredinibacter waterburyi]|uniref:hypothetical protein n=1 Tax=Teredinibacter waterburyi TaxID=1500538 RepID=UPI001FEB360F|nr:hypothetical protein [Teredinibacter waterburyi]
MMNGPNDDDFILEVLVERLNKQRLPHALSLQKKVDDGHSLNDFDIEFLDEVLTDLREAKPIYDRHPDHHELCTKLMSLYTDIINKGAKNAAETPE